MKLNYCAALAVATTFGCSSADPLSDSPPEEHSLGQAQSELRLAVVDRCSTSQKRKLRAAERLVYYITQPSIINWITEPRAGNKPHWIVDRFFDTDGIWDSKTTERVRSDFKRIHDRIGEGDVTVRCRDILSCNDSGVHAHVKSGGREKITFCDPYFAQEPVWHAAIWAHELSHELLGTKDRVTDEIPSNLHVLANRKRIYNATVTYVDGGGTTTDQYDGFILALVPEFFDAWYQSVGKGPITEREFDQAVLDVHHELDPLERIKDEVDRCWDGDTYSKTCQSPQTGVASYKCLAGKWEQTSACQSQCDPGERCCESLGDRCLRCVASNRACP